MFNRNWLLGVCLALAALAGCREAEPVRPALWQVDGPGGEKAWLLGTIHALPRRVAWRSATIDKALAGADRVVLEVARIDDQQALEASFAGLAGAPSPVPLRSRVPAKAQASYDRFLNEYDVDAAALDRLDTWAAAIVLAQAAQAKSGSDSGNGVDRDVRKLAANRPVEEFEGADGQFRIFDSLAEADQRDLLAAVVADPGSVASETRRLEQAWISGDLVAIEAETRTGMMADPELRAALLTGRNRAWTDRLIAMTKKGQRPFVAVGAAHLAGPDGLPALLEARGFRVTRVQ